MQNKQDRKRNEDIARREGETPKRDESMTERGLGNDRNEREESAREHDIARRQMPVHR